VILENRDLRDARIEAQLIVPRLIYTEDVGHLRVGHHGHGQRVVRRFHDDIMLAETTHAAAGAVNDALGLRLGRQRREFVGYHARLPLVAIGHAQNFGRRHLLVARAERAIRRERQRRLALALHDHLVRTLGAFGGDHYPFLGHEILAEFRHEEVSSRNSLRLFRGNRRMNLWTKRS
jgi:hypothetical protein